jgi:hypothetical protein
VSCSSVTSFALLYSLVRFLLDALLTRRQSELRIRAEVLALRHQLRVLERQLRRPRWQPADRLLLSALSRVLPRPAWSALLVSPATLSHYSHQRHLVRQPGVTRGAGLCRSTIAVVDRDGPPMIALTPWRPTASARVSRPGVNRQQLNRHYKTFGETDKKSKAPGSPLRSPRQPENYDPTHDSHGQEVSEYSFSASACACRKVAMASGMMGGEARAGPPAARCGRSDASARGGRWRRRIR